MRLADGDPETEIVAAAPPVTLHRVTSANWRDVADVRARRDQGRFVADVTRYLALCRYGGVWSPLEIRAHGRTVGFVMWGRDPADGSYWIGGFVIDRRQQRKGYGRATLEALDHLPRGEAGGPADRAVVRAGERRRGRRSTRRWGSSTTARWRAKKRWPAWTCADGDGPRAEGPRGARTK